MGRLAKVLSFFKQTRRGAWFSSAKVDPGGGLLRTTNHFAPPGDDSAPLPGDIAIIVPDRKAGREAAVGYVDIANEPQAAAGEKRIYARDEDGVVVTEVWLKNTGELVVMNGSGSMTIAPSGDITLNGVVIDISGNITTAGAVAAPSILADGRELTAHSHAILGGSSAPGPTGVNNP